MTARERFYSRLPAAFSHRDFRLLWAAKSASLIGDSVVTVALALFVIDLTGNPTDLGIVLVARTVPLVGLILIGGVWADRLPRHRLMMATDIVRFGLHGLLAALILFDAIHVWEIVVIEMLFGAAEAFFHPASSGLIPQTVPESEIQAANAFATTSENVADLIGPALATALVLGVGAGTAFALDAVTFAFSAVCLVGISPRIRSFEATDGPGSPGVLGEIRDGFREVRSRAWVWVTLVVFCVAVCCAYAPEIVLGPTVAEEQYGSVAVFGVLAAVFGAGSVVGSLVGIRWKPLHPMRLGMISILTWPPAFIFFALGVTLWVTIPMQIIAGVGFGLFGVWWMTALAERIPPQSLSRVTSYDWLVSLGLLPVGYVLAGPLANSIGASEVLAGGSAIALVSLSIGLLPRETRNLERLPQADPGARPPTLEHDTVGLLPRA